MQSGYVLDFTDATYGEFFKRHNINIHARKYQTIGTSKAKKLRSFWEQENDAKVGKVLSEMLDSYETSCELSDTEVDDKILSKGKKIVARLLGKEVEIKPSKTTDDFLHREFSIPNLGKLPIEASVIPIIEKRLKEAQLAMSVGAHLSVIFLCGSVLEAVLLGAAQQDPAKFNQARSSPKDDNGVVKKFHLWNLAQFIDAACEVDLIKPDVKKFGHGLRDFRNYIHPYQQMLSGFSPDEHTAKLCFQVLKAALAGVAGDR